MHCPAYTHTHKHNLKGAPSCVISVAGPNLGLKLGVDHIFTACHCSMCVAVFLPLALGVLSVTWPPLASVHSCMGQTAASDITELAGK